MKKNFFLHSLPFRLLVGVAFGICIGLLNIIDESAITTAVLNVVVTSKYILGQLISFSVPLIIIGFIAPSITRLGNNASRMLGVAVSIAYASSLGAALFSALSGYLLIPHLSFSSTASHLKALPDVVFELSIPQIMPVMSALVLAIMLGLASAWTKASLISSFLEEFQKIILAIVSRVIIPILPYFIGLTFCSLAYEGTITRQLPVFLQVIVIVLIGHFIWIALLYILAGIYSRENPLKVVKHYGPAYLTAIGTMSSAATLPVACLPIFISVVLSSQKYSSVWQSPKFFMVQFLRRGPWFFSVSCLEFLPLVLRVYREALLWHLSVLSPVS